MKVETSLDDDDAAHRISADISRPGSFLRRKVKRALGPTRFHCLIENRMTPSGTVSTEICLRRDYRTGGLYLRS